MFCNCNEKCFMITSITKSNDGIYQKIEKYKCNRLFSDGVKKQPCNFRKDIILKDIIQYNKTCVNNECTIIPTKSINKKINYREELNTLLKKYDLTETNYFGKLNYYMLRLGYNAHDPPNESKDELIARLSKPAIKKKNKIYVNDNSLFSQTIGEYDFDLELEKEIYERISLKENKFKYTEDSYIKELLTIKENNNYKYKNKSRKKNKTKKLKLSLDYLENKDLLSNEDENKNEDEDENDDDDENNFESENDKDNQFDIENNSDDDEYEDTQYDDFSD